MHYTEENDIPGVLSIIDFEKAFDTVSLNFIHRFVDFFKKFGTSIQTMDIYFSMQYRIIGDTFLIPLKKFQT